MVRRERFIPGPADAVFLMVLVLLLIGAHGLFSDPGTFWHLRLGREILATGAVPHSDTFTFTRTNEPWIDQSWGSDVLLALIVDRAGWPVVVALTAILIASIYASLARGLIAEGICPLIALLTTMLAVAIGSVHFLIRPHVLTLGLVYLTFRICQKQHERGGWIIAWTPAITALLANLHGGFLAIPVIVLTSALGQAVSGPWDQTRRNGAIKFLLAGFACVLAGLLNPYGWSLYQHVMKLLVTSGVTKLIEEYQPAPFGDARVSVLELVVLALIGLPFVVGRKVDRYQLVHLLVWLHLALTSIRNVPFFALAAAPALATLLDGLPLTFRSVWAGRTSRTIWPLALSLGLLCLAFSGSKLIGIGNDRWPENALATLDRQPLGARLFHEQDWGGLIESETQPTRLAYLDDRFELFGKEAILEYADALTGGPAWDTIRDRDQINLVWLKPDRGLARRLTKDPAWTILHQDDKSILFTRAPMAYQTLAQQAKPSPR